MEGLRLRPLHPAAARPVRPAQGGVVVVVVVVVVVD
jgi:hypothetical protein